MARLTFYIDDNDAELVEFVKSFGHFRSRIINVLLQECLKEGDGYVPLRIMQETGFSYKGKQKRYVTKTTTKKKTPVVEVTQSKDNTILTVEPTAEPTAEPTVKPTVEPKDNTTSIVEPTTANITPTEETQQDDLSSMPQIDKNLVMKGLSAFGL